MRKTNLSIFVIINLKVVRFYYTAHNERSILFLMAVFLSGDVNEELSRDRAQAVGDNFPSAKGFISFSPLPLELEEKIK